MMFAAKVRRVLPLRVLTHAEEVNLGIHVLDLELDLPAPVGLTPVNILQRRKELPGNNKQQQSNNSR